MGERNRGLTINTVGMAGSMGAIGNFIPWNFGAPIPSTVQFFFFILSCVNIEEGGEFGCYKVWVLPVNENEGQWEES